MSPQELDKFASIPEAFFRMGELYPDGMIYRQAVIESDADHAGSPRRRISGNYREVKQRVLALAGYLKGLGVAPGIKVAIISNTRPEWMEADLAILSLGGVVVSVYPSLTWDETGYLLFDSEAKVVFAENVEQVEKLLKLAGSECPCPATEERAACSAKIEIKRVITFEQTPSHPLVVSIGEALQTPFTGSIDGYKALTRASLATLVYTSGTTGPPKGVMQTHGNHLSNIRQAWQADIFHKDSVLMVFLPLAHSFAKLMGYIGFLTSAELEFPAVANTRSSRPVQESVIRDLREGAATVVLVVPRLLEKMQEGILRLARERKFSALMLRLTIWAAEQRQEAGSRNLIASLVYLLTPSIRAKVKARLFGKRFRYAVSGGAKLQPAVHRFFEAMRIEVLEGYGLTETCVATNVNRIGRKKIGTVGPVLAPDIEMRLADDGEILFRGPNIALGYYNRRAATDAAWDKENWFHTGDLGSIDQDGYLSIVGRKKELIVTSGGKKITPETIENQIKHSPYISQAVLYGDDKPYCVALLTLDIHAVAVWAKQCTIDLRGLPGTEPKVRELIQNHLDEINSHLASYETVKTFAIIEEEFSQDNGLLTPTLKVRRKEVYKRYREVIERLYQHG
ncbi:MAG: hypothetical protein DCC75_04350 [Proteobacteria bacterium]|nr:MAG: hypothetical protein DCC75_04350 [Pseudomonadota bacterium]